MNNRPSGASLVNVDQSLIDYAQTTPITSEEYSQQGNTKDAASRTGLSGVGAAIALAIAFIGGLFVRG